MRHYQWKEWIVGDIISGISVGAIHIPQSMGYAKLSEVPPPYGLYSTFFPLIVYFFVGTSRHLSIGTVSLVSLLVGSAVRKHLPAFMAAAGAQPSAGCYSNASLIIVIKIIRIKITTAATTQQHSNNTTTTTQQHSNNTTTQQQHNNNTTITMMITLIRFFVCILYAAVNKDYCA
jgi:MFS superfamily sulfate permease-like transporter